MLTATYTLVALSVEHANVRSNLQALQKLLHSTFVDQATLSPGQVGHAVDAARRLYDNYHWRKIDMFLLPALRNASEQANHLLRDLDDLTRTAAEAVSIAAGRLGTAAIDTQVNVAQFCAAIETFCSASLLRLEREERELFPLARAVISGETWFSIANKMMALDAYVQDSKPARPPAAAQARPVAHAAARGAAAPGAAALGVSLSRPATMRAAPSRAAQSRAAPVPSSAAPTRTAQSRDLAFVAT